MSSRSDGLIEVSPLFSLSAMIIRRIVTDFPTED